jgi:micrococcal nuclease
MTRTRPDCGAKAETWTVYSSTTITRSGQLFTSCRNADAFSETRCTSALAPITSVGTYCWRRAALAARQCRSSTGAHMRDGQASSILCVALAALAMGVCCSVFGVGSGQPASQQQQQSPGDERLQNVMPPASQRRAPPVVQQPQQKATQPQYALYANAVRQVAGQPAHIAGYALPHEQQQPYMPQSQFVQRRAVQGAGDMPAPRVADNYHPWGAVGSTAGLGAGFPSPYHSQPLPPDAGHKPKYAFRALVQRVADGDTCDVLPDEPSRRGPEVHGRVKVRLFGVDAPESKQVFGPEAGESLRALVMNTRVVVEVMDVDQYGRTVARLVREADGLDVNLEQTARGCAWVYTQFAKRLTPVYREAYFGAQDLARAGRRGLWAAPNPMNPREWRIQNPR